MLGVCLKYTQINYGSKLQALATVKTIERLGVDYEIIRYNKKSLKFFIKSLPRFFERQRAGVGRAQILSPYYCNFSLRI